MTHFFQPGGLCASGKYDLKIETENNSVDARDKSNLNKTREKPQQERQEAKESATTYTQIVTVVRSVLFVKNPGQGVILEVI